VEDEGADSAETWIGQSERGWAALCEFKKVEDMKDTMPQGNLMWPILWARS
jgi:hypothetical protein